jgi:hypothetical protein
LQTCDSNARRENRSSYLPVLLSNQTYTPLMTRMAQLVAVARSHGAAVRVSELNSAICGGLQGVSDTFATALWGTDVLFGLAEVGVRNVDFHTWTGSRYAPIDFVHGNGRTAGHVHPLFYAMLLFNRAAPRGSSLLPVGPNPPTSPIKTWATIDPVGTRRIVVINKDGKKDRKVVLTVPGGAGVATVSRLKALSLKSVRGVSFGGQSYGATTYDGLLRGDKVLEPLKVSPGTGTFKLVMPKASAALVTVKAFAAPPPAGGVPAGKRKKR